MNPQRTGVGGFFLPKIQEIDLTASFGLRYRQGRDLAEKSQKANRPLRRVIQQKVENVLSDALLSRIHRWRHHSGGRGRGRGR
ncbi:MAG: hypothetical protein K8R77_02460, partial [Anaerolineaceae bacterium]|nr:hypothetical protein [Anaerolineaceae bacterium]